MSVAQTDPSSMPRRAGGPTAIWVLAAAVAVGLVSGVALASITVSSLTEAARGGSITPARLAYWTQVAVWTTFIPGTVPPAVNTTVAAPTVLPATGTSYVVNSATSGHGAIQWNFTEATNAPASTEVEVTLTVTYGSTPATQVITFFVETQAVIPGTAQTFGFFFDAGAGATLLDTSVQSSQECAIVGACP